MPPCAAHGPELAGPPARPGTLKLRGSGGETFGAGMWSAGPIPVSAAEGGEAEGGLSALAPIADGGPALYAGTCWPTTRMSTTIH